MKNVKKENVPFFLSVLCFFRKGGGKLVYACRVFVAQLVKNPPAMWETWVQSLGWEDPLEKGDTIHSSILAWRIPWTALQRVGHG